MWLPVLSTYNCNDAVQNNDSIVTNSRYSKPQFIHSFSKSSSTDHSTSCAFCRTTNSLSTSSIHLSNKLDNKENFPTMSIIESVQNSAHETGDLNQANKLENKLDCDKSKAVECKVEERLQDKTESRLDNRLDLSESNCKLDENKKGQCKTEWSESKCESVDAKIEKVDKLVDKLAKLNKEVDANNNVCDKTANEDKSDSVREEKSKNKENEIMSSNTGVRPPHQCVPTGYAYSNGCTIANSSNRRITNKNVSSTQSNDSTVANSGQPSSAYTQHALNHSAHLSATPYAIYTTGHYSLNGQPTILSLPQNAQISHLHQSNSGVQSSLVNQTPINQSLNQPHAHLHHNHYHNQTHTNHAAHLHHYHQTANLQQNYHHSSFNHVATLSQQNNQKNLIKNSKSIKSLSSSVSASSLNSSTTVSNSSNNPNCNSTKSSIINSTYTPTYTNSNSPSSPTASTDSTGQHTAGQINQQTNHKNFNLNNSLPPHFYHSGYYSNNILNGKDTTYTFRKIFVGGLPYHSTDKTLSKFFQAFGEIEEAVVITDRQSGRSKGYGFVTMCDQESAERAVKDANPVIDGRKANVNLAYLGAKPRTSIPPNAGANLYSMRTNPANGGYSPPVISTNSQYSSLAPTAYMYSNGLLLSQAPLITGYPANTACAYFDYASSFTDPTHLTANLSPLNGPAAYAAQTGQPMNHSQGANSAAQYASPDGTLYAPISTDLLYGFAPIQHRF